jgi:transcriptional regulator with XRE-family HTH domain/tetratricopeptide (TPR) repeat protein
MSAPSSLAGRLRALRIAADLTLEALAERSGISARTISDIERGVSAAPQRRTVEALAAGLGLDTDARGAFLRAARARRHAIAEQRATVVAPHRVADFTGRDSEIDDVLAVLDRAVSDEEPSPAVILCGAPGLGKTTSALEALARRGERWPLRLFVDLAGLEPAPLTPLQVLRALLRQLPGMGEDVPTTLDAAAALWRTAAPGGRVAVVLDNAANEAQIRPVLGSERVGAVVVTSRRSLTGLEGAHRVTLGPLGAEDGILLLSRLIPAAQRGVGDLHELAALCDHVPLALRIAGTRIASRPAWTVLDFVARMRREETRLRLLVAGDLAVETAFALSYDDLEPETATVFRALAVIEGPTFDARIAAAVLDADVLDTEARLDELTDLGLLEARGGNRYRLHDLLRLFAGARLRTRDGAGGADERRRRLRGWLLASLERAGAWFEPGRTPDAPAPGGMNFPERETARAWIQLEVAHWWPALRAAAANGEHALVVDVADALHWFSDLWLGWAHWNELFSLSAASAQALGDPLLQATHLGYVAWTEILELRGDEAAIATARLALAAADAAGDDGQRGWAHFYAGWAGLNLGRLEEAAADARAAVRAFGSAEDPEGSAQAFMLAARVQRGRGEHELALEEFRTILEQAEEGSRSTHSPVLQISAVAARESIVQSLLALDRPAEAIVESTEMLALARAIESLSRIASALQLRARALIDTGDLSGARRDIDEALRTLGARDDSYLGDLRLLLERMRAEAVLEA